MTVGHGQYGLFQLDASTPKLSQEERAAFAKLAGEIECAAKQFDSALAVEKGSRHAAARAAARHLGAGSVMTRAPDEQLRSHLC